MQPAIVVWGDAHEEEGEHEAAKFSHAPIVTHCCGWVMRDDEAGVSLCQEWWDRDDMRDKVRHPTFIPRGMILQMTYLDLPLTLSS